MYPNSYGYNQYYGQQRYQPMEQSMQQNNQQQSIFNTVQNRSVLNGKQVESIDVVKAMDIPMDGTISYFPIADGSAIVSKQLQLDGTSKTVIFKPSLEDTKDVPKYVTFDELEEVVKTLRESIDNIDLSDIDKLKDKISDLKEDIRDIRKSKKKDD